MISRRQLLAGLAATPILTALPAQAKNTVTYTPKVLENLVAGGQPYLLDFKASWCSTCKAQERVLDKLQAQNPAYNAIPIVQVDWDEHRDGFLVAELAIPRRSTLVLMTGETELGRVVAQTGEGTIAALLDLAAA